jgi:hypothetical protein
MTKDEEHEEEAWKHCKKKSVQETNRLKPAPALAIAGHRLKPASAQVIAGHTTKARLNTGDSRSGQVNAPLAQKPPM